MENQQTNLASTETSQTANEHKVLAYLILLLLVLLIAGVAGTYIWQHNKVDTLNSKVSNLQSQLTSTRNTASATTSNEQIYNEVAKQFALQRSSLTYFRIFGQDKVQYSTGNGTTFAYKVNGAWYLAEDNSQSAVSCSQLDNVPEEFRPACLDNTNKLLYVRSNNTNLNYPIGNSVSYIGQ